MDWAGAAGEGLSYAEIAHSIGAPVGTVRAPIHRARTRLRDHLENKGAQVEGYAVAGGAETWRLSGFTNVHRTKITHRVS